MEGLAQGTQSQSLRVLTPKAGRFPVCVPEVWVFSFLNQFFISNFSILSDSRENTGRVELNAYGWNYLQSLAHVL